MLLTVLIIAALVPLLLGGRTSSLASLLQGQQPSVTTSAPVPSSTTSPPTRPSADVVPTRPPISLLVPSPLHSPANSPSPAVVAAPLATSPARPTTTVPPAAISKPTVAVSPTEAVRCQFALGFQRLRSVIGEETVGDCVDDVVYDPEGNAMQVTTRGSLLWRKADNWTAFTDGDRTWVYGPFGLQVRSSQTRFPWEQR